MGAFRFLYDNLITAETMFTVSSLADGVVSLPMKGSTAAGGPYGSAVMDTQRAFNGAVSLEYMVEIDSVFSGYEIGQASFRWSDNGGTTWNAQAITTTATWYSLNHNVEIKFTGGSGKDFEVGDSWHFIAFNHFKAGRMLDSDRDTRYRSSSLGSPNTITVDLGTAGSVSALVLIDHNLTASATITLKGNSSDSGWGTPEFSNAVTYNADKILHYLSVATSKRYWRLEISDGSNPDSYIEIGTLFLGPYLQLTKNVSMKQDRSVDVLDTSAETSFGLVRRKFHNLRRRWQYRYALLESADRSSLINMLTSISDTAEQKIKPVFFNPDADTPNDFYLAQLEGLPLKDSFSDRTDVDIKLKEVISSV